MANRMTGWQTNWMTGNCKQFDYERLTLKLSFFKSFRSGYLTLIDVIFFRLTDWLTVQQTDRPTEGQTGWLSDWLNYKKVILGEGLPYVKHRVARRTSQGLKKAALIPLGMFSLKRSSAGASAVPFRVLSRRTMTGDIWQSTYFNFVFLTPGIHNSSVRSVWITRLWLFNWYDSVKMGCCGTGTS